MKYTIKPEYADKFIGDINKFDSDALDSLKLNYPELMNKYFIEQ